MYFLGTCIASSGGAAGHNSFVNWKPLISLSTVKNTVRMFVSLPTLLSFRQIWKKNVFYVAATAGMQWRWGGSGVLKASHYCSSESPVQHGAHLQQTLPKTPAWVIRHKPVLVLQYWQRKKEIMWKALLFFSSYCVFPFQEMSLWPFPL